MPLDKDESASSTNFASEQSFFLEQKENIERSLLEISNIKFGVFKIYNIFKIIQQIRELLLVVGSYLVTYMLRFKEINKNEILYEQMIESLVRQIKILNDRIVKLENKK